VLFSPDVGVRTTWPGLGLPGPVTPHLLEEGLDLGSGDEDVGVAHPFRDMPEHPS
jgi:hypothetical protein